MGQLYSIQKDHEIPPSQNDCDDFGLYACLARPCPTWRPSRQEDGRCKANRDDARPHARISVARVQAPEEYGEFLSGDQDGFTFFDVDRKIDVTLNYEEVLKVKRGYGGYNHLRHTHNDRTRGFIAMGVVAALLIGLIAVVATSPN